MGKMSIIILLILSLQLSGMPAAEQFELSYSITGSAKGRILLIFPYRVFYTVSASLLFSTVRDSNGAVHLTLSDVNRTGSMMRTLGFSGRSLGIITADNTKSNGRLLSRKLKDELQQIAPEYSKYIKRTYWNHFTFKRIRDSIQFVRSEKGINSKVRYDLWMKRSAGEKALRINFSIYRILGEIIKANNYPVLPVNKRIKDLISTGQMNWRSGEIDFSEMLAQSALYAAGIFKRIKRLKQENSFTAEFFSEIIPDKGLIRIRGVAEPGVSIFRSFKIIKFIREIVIRVEDQQLISDRTVIKVSNDSGKGGQFISTLKLIES